MTAAALPTAPAPAAGTAARIAGAPISWGVCEVPGWGHQLTPDRVLREMRDAGLSATEFGPAGFLPDDPAAKARVLAGHGLKAVGGFVPVVLHRAGYDPVPEVEALLPGFLAAGADVLVLAAATGLDGYDERPALDDDEWRTLLGNLDRLQAAAAEQGVLAVLHPHVGTLVERADEVDRVLEGSSIALCLDTGHMLIGGTDPAQLAREHPGRVKHTHLKDVDAALAARVRAGELTYTEAIKQGMYVPLGAENVDIAGVVGALRDHGYTGWYVLEQDVILGGEPDGEGPVGDVKRSAAFLRGVVQGG